MLRFTEPSGQGFLVVVANSIGQTLTVMTLVLLLDPVGQGLGAETAVQLPRRSFFLGIVGMLSLLLT